MKEKPYLETIVTTTERRYNPNFGDNRNCECGHSYGRHFDSYENNEACGCKYCRCYTFVEIPEEIENFIKEFKSEFLRANKYRADVSYNKGWFRINSDDLKLRKSKMQELMDELKLKEL